jgi:hypothetical protein
MITKLQKKFSLSTYKTFKQQSFDFVGKTRFTRFLTSYFLEDNLRLQERVKISKECKDGQQIVDRVRKIKKQA